MIALLLGLLSAHAAASAPLQTCPCEARYVEFRREFDRPPAESTVDYFRKCNTFCGNLLAIEEHNANPYASYKVELKPLHDLTSAERARTWATATRTARQVQRHLRDAAGPPAARRFGAHAKLVPTEPRVRHQRPRAVRLLLGRIGHGGARVGLCAADGVAGAAQCAAVGRVHPGIEHNAGCGGGWPIDVFKYAKSNGGLCTEADIPYTIGNGMDVDCNATQTALCNRNITIKEILSVPTGNESLLLQALQRDVVSVAIDASGQGFYSYSEGVYDGTFNGNPDCSQTSLDHAVIAVGYGVSVRGGTPFYVVRNSWGATSWGHLNGYILFQRGSNTCGIAQDATFVTF